jgi:hypothetical protein
MAKVVDVDVVEMTVGDLEAGRHMVQLKKQWVPVSRLVQSPDDDDMFLIYTTKGYADTAYLFEAIDAVVIS